MAPELAKAAAAAKPATRAYVTFLAGDGDYWKGVVGLAKGLRRVGAAYPLVVAVLPDVPESHRRILVSQGCIVREIEHVYPPENQTQFAKGYYAINYSKLRVWEFVEYEKIVYLDADIQVYENIDELFELEKGHLYAVMDCFCDKAWSHTPQYKVGYCQQCPDKVAWPVAELGLPSALYFNAGLFVHEPSTATAKALLDALRDTPPTPFAEQDFLNKFFRDQYKPIPLEYNLVLATLLSHPENEQIANNAKVAHNYAARPWAEKLPPFSSRLTTKAAVFARQNVPAMATLAASSAALGVVTNAANPAVCFCFYAVFIAAMASVTISLRNI